jgi:hypothetical protein
MALIWEMDSGNGEQKEFRVDASIIFKTEAQT